jgi:hypothetical protein
MQQGYDIPRITLSPPTKIVLLVLFVGLLIAYFRRRFSK